MFLPHLVAIRLHLILTECLVRLIDYTCHWHFVRLAIIKLFFAVRWFVTPFIFLLSLLLKWRFAGIMTQFLPRLNDCWHILFELLIGARNIDIKSVAKVTRYVLQIILDFERINWLFNVIPFFDWGRLHHYCGIDILIWQQDFGESNLPRVRSRRELCVIGAGPRIIPSRNRAVG